MTLFAKTAPIAGYTPGPAWSNTPVTAVPAPASGLLPAGPACRPCPDCGGLECLCRPRFFAGQLLTEQDLNRLEHYIVAKNQLHNRYLVGEGVVGGLEVKCSPCSNTVSVSSGYAIDTCGNDIIVCSTDTVDICKLIKACSPGMPVNCAPYKDSTSCQDLEQEWILAIRYLEAPSRGMTPLTGSAQCSCGTCATGGCSCGGATKKASGGCCGGTMSAGSCCGQTVTSGSPTSTNLPRRGAPPSCEPTVTCEAYRYEVFLAPPTKATRQPVYGRGIEDVTGTLGGELFERFTCCIQSLVANLPAFPTAALNDQTTWSNYCCNLRQTLIQYVATNGGADCQALAKLQAVVCPGATLDAQSFLQGLGLALQTEFLIAFEFLVGCFCSAALPPCLPPGDPRVPLASVRVRASDCTILSVCNWTPLRKHVVTLKTLGYWLGWLPYGTMLRQFMQQVCCAEFGLPDQLRSFTPRLFGDSADKAEATQGFKGFDTPISFATRSYQTSNPIAEAIVANLASGTKTVDVGDLAQAMFTPVDPNTPADRLAESPHAKVMAEIARPIINTFGPLVSAAMGHLSPQASTTDTNVAITAMRAELDALRRTVTAQQSALDALGTPPAKPSA